MQLKMFPEAVQAAGSAANAVANTSYWILGCTGEETPPDTLGGSDFEGPSRLLVEFILEHPAVPVDAYWIRAGALAIHPFERRFDELAPPVQLAWRVFRDVLVTVSQAMTQAFEAEAARREQEEAEAAAQARREAKGPDPDSPFASIASPAGPSDLALSLAADKKAREAAEGMAGVDFPDPALVTEGQQDPAPVVNGQQDEAPAKAKRK